MYEKKNQLTDKYYGKQPGYPLKRHVASGTKTGVFKSFLRSLCPLVFVAACHPPATVPIPVAVLHSLASVNKTNHNTNHELRTTNYELYSTDCHVVPPRNELC